MSIPIDKQRWKQRSPCAECGMCNTGENCNPARKRLRDYGGIRHTSDGFDCALPVTIDSHSVCSFKCKYCFSDNLAQHREQTKRKIGQTSLKKIEKLFAGEGSKKFDLFRKALKYDDRNEQGYPCPVQVGGITDPMDNIERQQGWLKKLMKLALKYNQPLRLSTKGNLAKEKDYLEIIEQKPELFWFHFSTITPDKEKAAMIEKDVPSPQERLKAMKALSDVGAWTSLRLRPAIPGVSDSTDAYPDAYKTLIERAGDAGADAISYEVMFLDGMPHGDIKRRYEQMEEITGVPLMKVYDQFGKNQKCTRPSYKWTENIMFAIKKEALKQDMWVGVSDPVWGQLNETGSCCGIPRNHPQFGNWERENATNRLLEARIAKEEYDKTILIGPDDIIPEWAYETPKDMLVNPGAGPTNLYARRHTMWADKLRETWNGVEKERGTLKYFQGALKPVKKIDGDIYYKYVGLNRRKKENIPYWDVGVEELPENYSIEREWHKNIDFSKFKVLD